LLHVPRLQAPGFDDPNKPPGFDCKIPIVGPGVRCTGRGDGDSAPYDCTCVDNDGTPNGSVKKTFTEFPKDTEISDLAMECGGACPPTIDPGCALHGTCDGTEGGDNWSCSTQDGYPTVTCKHTAGQPDSTCRCNGTTKTFQIPNTTTNPKGDQDALEAGWKANCTPGVCALNPPSHLGGVIVDTPPDGGIPVEGGAKPHVLRRRRAEIAGRRRLQHGLDRLRLPQYPLSGS
jgi:hypothetical protein